MKQASMLALFVFVLGASTVKADDISFNEILDSCMSNGGALIECLNIAAEEADLEPKTVAACIDERCQSHPTVTPDELEFAQEALQCTDPTVADGVATMECTRGLFPKCKDSPTGDKTCCWMADVSKYYPGVSDYLKYDLVCVNIKPKQIPV